MTAAVNIAEAVETSDLDMMDGLRHAACNVCHPGYLPFGTPFVGFCGRRVISKGRQSFDFPPDGCLECESLRYDPCPRCGA